MGPWPPQKKTFVRGAGPVLKKRPPGGGGGGEQKGGLGKTRGGQLGGGKGALAAFLSLAGHLGKGGTRGGRAFLAGGVPRDARMGTTHGRGGGRGLAGADQPRHRGPRNGGPPRPKLFRPHIGGRDGGGGITMGSGRTRAADFPKPRGGAGGKRAPHCGIGPPPGGPDGGRGGHRFGGPKKKKNPPPTLLAHPRGGCFLRG